ncbi:hypothetical protein SAMN04488109_4976 [Chryseolinea serpens]|uniref:Uncharacterized protein n=1 Tax=Chryseolinea serpens TaxID=947013 RepID=A0A1M5VBC9_9BACT|nr:hypothetical protein SAMN04488109_4976 [Chryseolinea serpens]
MKNYLKQALICLNVSLKMSLLNEDFDGMGTSLARRFYHLLLLINSSTPLMNVSG